MMGGNAYAPIQHRSADEDVAGIVRQIFEWAADSNTAAEITGKLYAMNIPTLENIGGINGKTIIMCPGHTASGAGGP